MEATTSGTTQTQAQTHRSHGVGSNPENAGAQQLPLEIIAEVFSDLTLMEQTNAMAAVSPEFRERVAPHIHEPSEAHVVEALRQAITVGNDDVVRALSHNHKAVSELDDYVNTLLHNAIYDGNLSTVYRILENWPFQQATLRQIFYSVVAMMDLQSCPQQHLPHIALAVARQIDFDAPTVHRAMMSTLRTLPTHDSAQCIFDIISPHLTVAEFEEARRDLQLIALDCTIKRLRNLSNADALQPILEVRNLLVDMQPQDVISYLRRYHKNFTSEQLKIFLLAVRSMNNVEMLQGISEVIGPRLTDAEFAEVMRRGRRLNEFGGCCIPL